jgi:hypothetical protein
MTIDLNEREDRVLRAYDAAGIPTPLGHPTRRFYAAVRAALPAIEDGRLQHVGGKWFATDDRRLLTCISMAIASIRIQSGKATYRLTEACNVRSALRTAEVRGVIRARKKKSLKNDRHPF